MCQFIAIMYGDNSLVQQFLQIHLNFKLSVKNHSFKLIMALVFLFSQKGSDRRDPHQAKLNDIIWLNAENARYFSKMVKNI